MSGVAPDSFRLSGEHLASLAQQFHREYITAQPFPHVVIDDFLPPDVAAAIVDEFPKPGSVQWKEFSHANSRKLALADLNVLKRSTVNLIQQLNAKSFLLFLEALTGIADVIPDAHLMGGGLHQIERGGLLKIHADFNVHPRWKLDRRLNLLLYFNRDWAEAYGGHLELWDREMTRCVKRIMPIFNRCVIFNTTDFSYHGHPDPLACPEGETRKSVALYYYTNGRPEEERSESHFTLWQRRPSERPAPSTLSRPTGFKARVKRFVPPVLIDIARGLRNRL